MKIDVDGERSKLHLPWAKKLLSRCKLAGVQQKTVIIDGFLVSAAVGDDLEQDAIRIVAPTGVTAVATLPDKVTWFVANGVEHPAAAHPYIWCAARDADGVCTDERNPYVTSQAQVTGTAQVPVRPFAAYGEGLRVNHHYNVSGATTWLDYKAHCWGVAEFQPDDVAALEPPSYASADINTWLSPASAWFGKGMRYLQGLTLLDRVSAEVDPTLAEFVVSLRVFADQRTFTQGTLYVSDIAGLLVTHPDADMDTALVDHFAAVRPATAHNAVAQVQVWVRPIYQLVGATGTDGDWYAEARVIPFYFDWEAGWYYLGDEIVQIADPGVIDQPGTLDMPFPALAGTPYVHNLGRVTFYDDNLGDHVTWGRWDADDPASPVGAYAHRTPITATDAAGLRSFYEEFVAGPVADYTFPPGTTDVDIRPDYVEGDSRWFMVHRRFDDLLTRFSRVDAIYLGTPWTSWEQVPLPGTQTYEVTCSMLDRVPADPLNPGFVVELVAVAKDVDGLVYIWVYRDRWGPGDDGPRWERMGQLDPAHTPVDPRAALWSIALYGNEITSRQEAPTGQCQQLPSIPTPAAET